MEIYIMLAVLATIALVFAIIVKPNKKHSLR